MATSLSVISALPAPLPPQQLQQQQQAAGAPPRTLPYHSSRQNLFNVYSGAPAGPPPYPHTLPKTGQLMVQGAGRGGASEGGFPRR